MGCVSSCFRVEDIDEYMNPNSSVYRNCPCIRCLAHNFLNLVTACFTLLFQFMLLMVRYLESFHVSIVTISSSCHSYLL